MTDEELIEQTRAMIVTYCDGFGAYRKLNGVLRCVGWSLDAGAQVNLAVSLAGADAANRENRRVLDTREAPKGMIIWNGTSLPH